MFDFLKQLTDPQSIIHYGGLWLLLFVVFAETGLLVGFFLPGDSLIFISGLLCATKPDLLNISLIELLILLMLAAIIGNVFGPHNESFSIIECKSNPIGIVVIF